MKKRILAITLVLCMALTLFAGLPLSSSAAITSGSTAPIRITCVGDSITEGYGSSFEESYPMQMQKMLGDGYVVTNCGTSGSNVMSGRGYVYRDSGHYTNSINSNPDIVIIALGTNDAGNGLWYTENGVTAEQKFYADYKSLVQSYINLPSKPVVMVALPTYSWNADGTIDSRCRINKTGTIPIINRVA